MTTDQQAQVEPRHCITDSSREQLCKELFTIDCESRFEDFALRLYRYQYERCKVYRQWNNLLNISPASVHSLNDIPALPIELFKTNTVVSFTEQPIGYFQSSGTTAQVRSRHYYRSLELYNESLLKGFEAFWGNVEDYCIVALLPNYLAQGHSSLIHMVDLLTKASRCPSSAIYGETTDKLVELLRNYRSNRRLMLIGVSYALLDLTADEHFQLPGAVLMETGGMKGRRKELPKPELHELLKERFGVNEVASEYGMCELFSQAYSTGKGVFKPAPWMKVRLRDTAAPMHTLQGASTGGIDIIDLANIDSCAFIATQDLGRRVDNNLFEIVGRFDHSDVRGCNLMAE